MGAVVTELQNLSRLEGETRSNEKNERNQELEMERNENECVQSKLDLKQKILQTLKIVNELRNITTEPTLLQKLNKEYDELVEQL